MNLQMTQLTEGFAGVPPEWDEDQTHFHNLFPGSREDLTASLLLVVNDVHVSDTGVSDNMGLHHGTGHVIFIQRSSEDGGPNTCITIHFCR